MSIKKAVIPVAGLGTRFLPATKAVPKELFPIVDTPILERLISELSKAGIEEVLLIISREKGSVINHFTPNKELENTLKQDNKIELLQKAEATSKYVNITYKVQLEPKGFADAIYMAKDFVGDEPFILCVGDEMFYGYKNSAVEQLINVYNKYGKSVVALAGVEIKDTCKYGVIDPISSEDRVHFVKRIVEKPKINPPSNLVSIGKYLLTSEIFSIIKDTPIDGKEVNFSHCLTTLAKSYGLTGLEVEGVRYDTGDKVGFVKANVEFALRDGSLHDEMVEYLKGLVKSLDENSFL